MTMTDAPTKLMTTEEFLALPDDGIERMLIEGVVHEFGSEGGDMTKRNPTHSFVEANATRLVGTWSSQRPEPRGRVYCGEVGFRMKRGDNAVGIDVAYVDAATAAKTPKSAALVEGPPVLAIEVLSPSDRQEVIMEKVRVYLAGGANLVWVLETMFETVVVYRPDAAPTMLSADQELTAEPHLSGFRCKVSDLFGS